MAGGEPDYARFFPYDEPYDHQADAMAAIDSALEDGDSVLLEGPCGTGKTLAALVPALSHARETDRTVVITTNVHQQMRQFVADARAITRTEPIRAVVFRGKASMCHIDVDYQECQALRDATREQVDLEEDRDRLSSREDELLDAARAGDGDAAEARGDLVEELRAVEADLEALIEERSTCEHYYRNLATDTSDFFAWLHEDVRTPDDVYEYADDAGLCGYELLKEGMEAVDLVVCNYHHLLDRTIREQFFRWLDRDPEDVVAVFDEAHNVESAARDHARRTLTETTIEEALAELEEADDARARPARNVLTAFRDALETAYRDAMAAGPPVDPGEHWEDLTIANDDRRDDLTLAFLDAYEGPGFHADLDQAVSLGEDLRERYDEAFRQGDVERRRECQTLQAATFVNSWLEESDEQGLYPVASVRRGDRGTGDVYGRAELYTCIPSAVTGSLFSDLHAAVLMSATLRPFDVTRDVLGLEEGVELAYDQPFPPERRRTYAVDTPALFSSSRDDGAVTGAVADALADVVRMTPGNVLAFFPSYAEAARYDELLGDPGPGDRRDRNAMAGVRTYLDEAGTQARDLRESFVADDDGLLLTSMWGTLGEGVSYEGEDARAVVVVGVPYPRLDDRLEAVQAAYDVAFEGEDAGWRYAVEVPTIRKTRQALGRVVRSPGDFGARVLLDERYTQAAEMEMRNYAVRGTFPPAERRELIDMAPEKLRFGLRNFFSDLDAYDGDPPEP